ncbi:TonB-dependent receptor [Acidocella sp.]|jgi:iron complex outermembrane receptor protein|uniref:TonB-dependent receptor n=1 Tax=Acidocella sp. TaxID=50710 RepID=UPI002F4145BA
MVHHFTLRRVLGRASSYRALGLAMSGFGVMLATTPLAVPAQAQSVTPQSAPTVGATGTTVSTGSTNLDLGAVLSTGSGSAADLATTPGTAPYEAPSLTPLNSIQPTSVINQRTIQKQLIGSESYADAAALSPSVSTISPNGPGLMENQGLTIRGFQDGQFNVTFDGIPIGDSNDFTHHTTSFFMNNDIGQVIVDRGPGTAETVGDATFGGTISVRTKDPLATPTVTPYGEYGSYHTNLGGIELDTGAIQSANGTSAIIDVEHLGTSGALQGASQERKNFFGKVVVPVNANTTVTALAMYNDTYQNPSIGATLDQMAAFGHNFAYSGDPNSQAFNRFNNDHITTDMEYLDVTSNLGDGWQFDGKLYTYGYYHHDLNGIDPGDQLPGGVTAPGGVPNEVVLTPGGVPQPGVPGNNFTNSYRSVGTIDRWQKNFSVANMPSDFKFGVWFDHQVNTRAVTNVDLTDGNVVDFSQGSPPVVRAQENQLYTFQPYAQLDVTPIQNLTLTAGVKYAFFRRQIKDAFATTSLPNIGFQHNWDKLLPSAEARYSFSPNLSAYVQAAEGFLAPNVNFLNTANDAGNSFNPETTWNYQTGFAYQSQHLALGGDIYLIHFTNLVATGPTVDGITNFFNAGGAIYKGVEGEGTYTFDNGISVFANGALNKAGLTASNDYIAEVPQFTSNFGVIYNKNNIYASVVDQLVGGEYDGNGSGNGGTPLSNPRAPGAWYDPYNIVNLVGGYTFVHPLPHVQALDVKLNLDNITNQQQIIWSPGAASSGQDLYYVLPGISAFVSVSVPIGF